MTEPFALRRAIRPLALIFVLTTGLFIAGRFLLPDAAADVNVLIIGNILLFGVTLITFYLYSRTFYTKSPYAITRMMYGSVLIRMLVCLAAAAIYIMAARKGVSKPGIIGCLVLYFIYTGVEVSILMKGSKQNKNA